MKSLGALDCLGIGLCSSGRQYIPAGGGEIAVKDHLYSRSRHFAFAVARQYMQKAN